MLMPLFWTTLEQYPKYVRMFTLVSIRGNPEGWLRRFLLVVLPSSLRAEGTVYEMNIGHTIFKKARARRIANFVEANVLKDMLEPL